jgi:hypothetical protein
MLQMPPMIRSTLVIYAFFALLAAPAAIHAMGKTPEVSKKGSLIVSFEESIEFKKLNSRLKQLWRNNRELDRASQKSIRMIIRTQHSPTKSQFKKLSRAGFNVNSRINTILTGQLMLDRLPQLAKLDFVESIEGNIEYHQK